jgi:hypothetical protein
VGKGVRRPRFAVVAVEDADLQFCRTRIRRAELEKITSEIGAEIVYLPRREHADEPEMKGGKGRRRRRQRDK